MKLEGRWRIIEMELWDHDAIDLVGPGLIEIRSDGTGSLGFIAVEGWMDIRDVDRAGLSQASSSRGKATTRAMRPVAADGQRSRKTAR